VDTGIKVVGNEVNPYPIEYGHIPQIVGRSTFDSPADRHFGKTSRLNFGKLCSKSINTHRASQDLGRHEDKTFRGSKSAMGKAKTYRCQQSRAKEGRAHTSGTKETFPTDESSVGSNKKSCRRQKITYGLRPMRVYRPAVDCLNLSKAGWSWGCVSTVGCNGRTIFIADAHRDDGKHFVVRADEKLTAFVELESTIFRNGGDTEH
jgi:hypothetical protein